MKTNLIQLKWKLLHSQAELPAYATQGAAAFDIKAAFDGDPMTLAPGHVMAIPTGLAVEIPLGYELQIRARSGLALKFGFSLVNGVGTIDSDYRGEIRVIATVLSQNPYVIRSGDRIAQGILAPVTPVQNILTDELSVTERGVGGFGSTGI